MQAVIAAFHLDDAIAAGSGASQADGVHGAFRAAIAETNHLDGKALADFLGEFPFEIMRHAEHGAGAEFRLHRLDHRGMAMSGHQRAEAKIEVEILVAVDIVNVSAFSIADKNRIGIVGAIIAGDAQWQAAFALCGAPLWNAACAFRKC